MKKTLFLFCSFCLILCTIQAQGFGQNDIIEGTILNENGVAVDFATITILHTSDSSLLFGSISDTNGHYQIEIPAADSFFIQFKHLLYRDTVILLYHSDTSRFYQNINLSYHSHLLNELTISGSRMRYEAGLYTFNLTDSKITQNKDMGQVLNRLPGLMFRDGVLTLEGKKVGLVYLDGKELKNLEDIKDLQGQDIEEVQIQKTTGSSFAADVRGGIVRIKTKNKQGYSLDLIYEPLYSFDRDIHIFGNSFSAPYRFRQGKFSLTNRLKLSQNQGGGHEEESAIFNQDVFNTTSLRKTGYSGYHVFDRLDLTYSINKNIEVGGVVAFRYMLNPKQKTSEEHTIPYVHQNVSDTKLPYAWSNYSSLLENGNDFQVFCAADYLQKFDSLGSNLSIKIDFLHSSSKSKNEYHTQQYTIDSSLLYESLYRITTPIINNIYTARADYSFFFREGRHLDAGVTYYGYFASDVQETKWYKNGNSVQEFEEKEKYTVFTHQSTVYMNYRDFLGNFSYYAGASFQYDGIYATNINNECLTNQFYLRPFASLGFGYNFNKQKGTSLDLSFKRGSFKVPSFKQLSPREIRLSESTYYIGNEGLNIPTYYDISLSFVFQTQLRINYGFTIEENCILNTLYTKNNPKNQEKIVYQKPINAGKRMYHSLYVSWNKDITDWLYVDLSIESKYCNETFNQNKTIRYTSNSFFANVSGDLDFTILPSMGTSVGVWYDTPTHLLTEKYNGDLGGSFSVYKTFFNRKLYITLSLRWRGWDRVFTNWAMDNSYQITTRYSNPFVQGLYLTVRYRFSQNNQDFREARTSQTFNQ